MKLPIALAASLLLMAACAQVEKVAEPVVIVEPPAPPPAPPEEVPPPVMESQPLRHLLGRNLKPIPTLPLSVKSRCSHRDAIGTRTNLNLLVKEAEVKAFTAKVDIPKHGSCRFDLKDFNQTAKLPQALLTAKDDSGCSVRMWQQENQVTIAFNSCPKACDGEAFSYLWPILVEAKTGRCS